MVVLIEFIIALSLFGTLVVAWFLGKRLGHMLKGNLSKHPQLGVVQGSIFGLLGLLLGLCFAGALNRFVERQQIIVREANAVGTAYLRADLLPEAQRAHVKSLLREYTQQRIDLFSMRTGYDDRKIQDKLTTLHEGMWASAVQGTREDAELGQLVLPPLNEVLDLLGERNAADRRHIPVLVTIVLIASAMASIAALGLGIETGDKRLRAPASILAFLIATTLWTTLDLDFPRSGLITIDARPLREALDAMATPQLTPSAPAAPSVGTTGAAP